MFAVFGWIFNILFVLPYAYYQKQTALNALSEKIGSQTLNLDDPAIAKVVIQARKLLKNQGFEFPRPSNEILKEELIKTLKPVFLSAFGKSESNPKLIDQYYYHWLTWVLSKDNPGFVSEETAKYTSLNIIKETDKKLQAFAEFYFLNLDDLKEIISGGFNLKMLISNGV
jgi:hypothetical protein